MVSPVAIRVLTELSNQRPGRPATQRDLAQAHAHRLGCPAAAPLAGLSQAWWAAGAPCPSR